MSDVEDIEDYADYGDYYEDEDRHELGYHHMGQLGRIGEEYDIMGTAAAFEDSRLARIQDIMAMDEGSIFRGKLNTYFEKFDFDKSDLRYLEKISSKIKFIQNRNPLTFILSFYLSKGYTPHNLNAILADNSISKFEIHKYKQFWERLEEFL